MSQRVSGYERKEADCYETPQWVTEALIPYLPAGSDIWEPACGSGKITNALQAAGHLAMGSDISNGDDFLKAQCLDYNAIVTNPPFALATEFIEKALELASFVAMLLRADFDHAKTRQHLFGKCPWFAKKLALTKRIVWFERPGAAPSFNHAWYIWDKEHKGLPSIVYGP